MILDRADSTFLIVDLQARLMPAINGGDAVVAKALFLAETAKRLGVPILATEQNPRGLGPTVPELLTFAQEPFAKRHFSATREPGFFDRLPEGRKTILVAGAETHVCVLQTVLGLLDRGFAVAVAADAVGSRYAPEKDTGLRRMRAHGVEIVTAEMAAFEWLGTCDDPEFRALIGQVKDL